MKTMQKISIVFVAFLLAIGLSAAVYADDMNEASVESTAAASVVEKAVPVVEKININTGTVDEIAKLKRVGRKYAQRIIEYREKNGLFQTSEDIMKVRGIGKKTYENNKNRISVEAQVQSEKNSAGE